MRVMGRGEIILSLVEEGAGLLARQRRDHEPDPVLIDLDLLTSAAALVRGPNDAPTQLETFQLANASIVALTDDPRLEFINQQFDKPVLRSGRAL